MRFTSKRKRRYNPFGVSTAAYLWLFLGMLVMLVSASFAWFSVGSRGCVSEMALYINTPAGLELSLDLNADDEDWTQNIDLSALISEDSVLKPVTWSNREQCFKAIRYGTDGRMSGRWRTLSDAQNANTKGSGQYYVFCTYYARSDTSARVSLAEAVELSDGRFGAGTYVVGAPIWNGSRHTNAGKGAEYAVRVGFRITPVDPKTGAALEDPVFYIYEPNADSHRDGTKQLLNTASTDGTTTLISPDRIFTQTTTSWREASPVQRGVTQKTLGSFSGNTDLFTIHPLERYKIDMYIWVEGQDVDCYGLPEQAKLAANIQFAADYTEQSGLVEIPGA